MDLSTALVTIRRFLRQKDLNRFGALVDKLTDGHNPFEQKLDWHDVFFISDHLGGSGPLFRAATNLTLKPQEQCSLQVVIGTDASQVQAGLDLCIPKKPVLVIAFAKTFEETKNIKDLIKGKNIRVKNKNNSIRFDFVDPDLHRLKLLQEEDLSAALFERVKEGVLAFQMDVENYAVTVEESEFRDALQTVSNELDINKLLS